jgi:hypothetical protein
MGAAGSSPAHFSPYVLLEAKKNIFDVDETTTRRLSRNDFLDLIAIGNHRSR